MCILHTGDRGDRMTGRLDTTSLGDAAKCRKLQETSNDWFIRSNDRPDMPHEKQKTIIKMRGRERGSTRDQFSRMPAVNGPKTPGFTNIDDGQVSTPVHRRTILSSRLEVEPLRYEITNAIRVFDKVHWLRCQIVRQKHSGLVKSTISINPRPRE
ncbi:hypothetical protein OBBRIDRAFT_806697 [Obba rivulosa]|uniref:Uncharacterized protein n=1 Tax=Obba rivulosa TaxID=1052685 RepID=A0A8E2ALU6_9APHY|nr:hypothetical protein OBBRIDRAFT_806697 [Obba rivulosa]